MKLVDFTKTAPRLSLDVGWKESEGCIVLAGFDEDLGKSVLFTVDLGFEQAERLAEKLQREVAKRKAGVQ